MWEVIQYTNVLSQVSFIERCALFGGFFKIFETRGGDCNNYWSGGIIIVATRGVINTMSDLIEKWSQT